MTPFEIPGKRLFNVADTNPPTDAPDWLPTVLDDFRTNVGDAAYPCYFGRRALRYGELFGTWVDRDGDLGSVRDDLATFLDATRPFPRRRMVLALFCAPDREPQRPAHEEYGRRFWSILQFLHDHDDRPWPARIPTLPTHSRWEFSFHGVPMFVFAAAPTHAERRSRHLGDGLVLLFQPRNVFDGIEGGTPAGIQARRRIRDQLAAWDTAPHHPLMGDYGDPSNFEWKQYYVADDTASMYASCPLHLDTERLARSVVAQPGECLHHLIEERARRTPHAVAVIAGDVSLDYQALDRRANRLAHQLVAEGVGPEDRVGVMVDRSADAVVAMLGVLKAGAAYVPIDPGYPDERRVYLLEDAGVDVVVAPGRLLAAVPVGPRRLVSFSGVAQAGGGGADGTLRAVAAQPAHPDGATGRTGPTGAAGADDAAPAPPERAVRPDNLAYIIYTSGSTGAPKGVMVTHRQLVAATRAQRMLDRPDPEAFLMPISFSFDASGVGLYWTLTTGGCLIIPVDDEHRDPERLRDLARRYGATHSDCTPALYDLILGTDPAPLRTLRCVVVGGEACPPELLARHRALLPDCLFENNYGPTEVAVWAMAHVVGPDSAAPPPGARSVPIGRPVAGLRCHLLDESLRPVPPGRPGELYFSGAAVARGYHDRPALTADRFVPSPFAADPGARMYRTGDIARELPDGTIEFVGRRDAQVKVRGHRVELGEVEAALQRHPDVAEAVVDVRVYAGEPVLVAYIRPRPGLRRLEVALRAHLSPLLPASMLPSRYVQVDAMPRTVSGKIDRAVLPDPQPAVPEDAAR